MKVGTDGVLIGAWSEIGDAKSILDVGAGSGLVSLMLAQRSDAHITGIELDDSAANQAIENILVSPWSHRVSIICGDFLLHHTDLRFDLIVSNPPFFEQSLLPPDAKRTNARHTETLNYETLLQKSVELLAPNGRISLIVPADKEFYINNLAKKINLHPSRICYVLPKLDSLPKRLLIEFSFVERPVQTSQLIIETSRHHYSEEYIALTKDFYLKM
jgi:tRNA1Val (adenine37-N6)-methyltransferase